MRHKARAKTGQRLRDLVKSASKLTKSLLVKLSKGKQKILHWLYILAIHKQLKISGMATHEAEELLKEFELHKTCE